MLKITAHVALATGDTAIIEADHPMHLNEALVYLQSIGALKQQPAAANTNIAANTGEGVQTPEGQKELANSEKPKRQSKTTKASAGNAAQPAAGEQTAPTPDATTTTKRKPEDVTAAVTNLANATNLAVARSVLEQFGVKRAAELKPEQYDAFIAACEAKASEAKAEDVGDVL
jgi:hypothetical protein